MNKTIEQFPDLKDEDLSRFLPTSRARRAYEAVWLLALAWNSSEVYQDVTLVRNTLNEAVWTTKVCALLSKVFITVMAESFISYSSVSGVDCTHSALQMVTRMSAKLINQLFLKMEYWITALRASLPIIMAK